MPIRRMVMKSRLKLNLSGPFTGRFSTPNFSIGSGSWPALAASSRLACTEAAAAWLEAERWTPSCSACSSVNPPVWARPGAGSRANAARAPKRNI